MKKILLYIFAIPLGIISAAILPIIYSHVLSYFIPFQFVDSFLQKYLIPFLGGWIAVAVTAVCAPSKRLLFAGIMLLINILTSLWMFRMGDNLDYMFILGSIACFVYILINRKGLSQAN